MKAICWEGINKVSTERVPDPTILNPRDAIVRVILSSVCGSDLHLLGGYIPAMRAGDIIGHEFMGEIVEVGPEVKNLKKGDRVVVCSVLACGGCEYCQREEYSLCDNSNAEPEWTEKAYGYPVAGIFGYSHALGGYAGSHAEYTRVPFAENTCFKVPDGVSNESALFTSDAFPTGYMAADFAGIEPGDTVVVWGCGGVGLMAMHSAWLLGAGRVIAIDQYPYRLEQARTRAKAEVLNFKEVDVLEALKEMTGGRGPDRCIDCVGMEADSTGVEKVYDYAKQYARLQSDRPAVLRQAIMACRKGGTVSIIGVYGGLIDKFPMGPAMNKGLTFRMGQQFGQRYIPTLLDIVARREVDPAYLLTHKLSLDKGQEGYMMFKEKANNNMRSVFAPAG